VVRNQIVICSTRPCHLRNFQSQPAPGDALGVIHNPRERNMNKQMHVALAMVLAAAVGSAAAQSNVTVYGVIDTSVGRGYKSDASA
jgi:hypothetical protein